jgi:hypothetical protein
MNKQKANSEKQEASKREAESQKSGLPAFVFWLRDFLL